MTETGSEAGASPKRQTFAFVAPVLEGPRLRLYETLCAVEGPLYAVLDAARDVRALNELKEEKAYRDESLEFRSLYDGESAQYLEMFSPFLVRLKPGSFLLKTLAASGWGNSWGIFVACKLSLPELRKHFRHFLTVDTPDGKSNYFRWYDPRVLRVFLPTCKGSELKEFFGPVQAFIAEDKDPDVLLRFSLSDPVQTSVNLAND